MFESKIVAITGGTGSFGSQISSFFQKKEVSEIRIFSRDEKKQEEMRLSFNDERFKFCIGDVRDQSSINEALKGVDYVFHAAALKQVPSCEFYPLEAIKTNILGTNNVLESCVLNNVSKTVILSTDKAVYPINAMGQSKALMEKVAIAKGRLLDKKDTIFSITRYGNVMASRGSIIPLLVSQIKSGQDLTITDPNMTRFMMSLKDSVDLVLHAFKNSSQGDIYVQKSPACTVAILVEAMKEIFGSKNKVKIIGTRHGEKLYESLVSREEMVLAKDEGDFYKIPADIRDLNYSKFYTDGNPDISNIEEYNSHNTKRLSLEEVIKLLLKQEFIKKNI